MPPELLSAFGGISILNQPLFHLLSLVGMDENIKKRTLNREILAYALNENYIFQLLKAI